MSEEEQNNIIDDGNQSTTGGEATEPQDGIQTEGNTEGGGQPSEESSSSGSSSDALPHYHQSPNMICVKLTMNGIDADTVDKLKAMDIDRRWECDNRIPTWKFGLVNMGHDFHFVHNGGTVCDTDDRLMKIESDVDTEDGAIRKQTATRNIKYNGQGLQIDTSREE